MIHIRQAPAYATVQDMGRRGFMSSGVPRAGAMDLPALRTLNALLGNDDGAAVIEWTLTGGAVEFTDRCAFAVGGASVAATFRDAAVEPYRVYNASTGDVLSITELLHGRFLYIAVAGGLDVPMVMGSRSTYLPGGFGGIEGRRLRTGDRLTAAHPVNHRRHHLASQLPAALRPPLERKSVKFIPRVEDAGLHQSPWTLSQASDRTGYRLTGEILDGGASIVSEPVCAGVIQLPPGGAPIVLMADAPTIGGYRILGAVTTADLGILAQVQTGRVLSFEITDMRTAAKELLAEAQRLEAIREWVIA